ncbi:MAG: OPT family oligopeptide transporter, partial [Myxococcota bacterium]
MTNPPTTNGPMGPELTLRAIATGMILGGVLSLVNIYTGLKIGWGFNMSITAMLLSVGFYQVASRAGAREWGMLENNIGQTAASAGANISSAGLVAPIPALTMITGMTFSWAVLSVWTFAVAFVGVVVAVGLRRQMLEVDKLPFANGIASAETIKSVYSAGSEAMARVKALVIGGLVGGVAKLAIHVMKWKHIALPGALGGYPLMNLGFSLNPSPLMVAVGTIVGPRAGISMLIGAAVAFGWLAPHALDAGWAAAGDDPAKSWFGSINKWMLWPGVSLMVTASLTSFAFSWRSIAKALRGTSNLGESSEGDVPRSWFIGGLVLAMAIACGTQMAFFDLPLWVALTAVLLTFLLAIVAGRVSGETNITPVGAMGKVTQLTFGILNPGNAASNLMAANVTGGAASQTADMLHDLKTGLLIGATPRFQAIAQVFGVMAGALAGSAAYLLIIPDPTNMLLTDDWPAPAVAAWKGVAELFLEGLDAMPEMAVTAMAIAGGAGV